MRPTHRRIRSPRHSCGPPHRGKSKNGPTPAGRGRLARASPDSSWRSSRSTILSCIACWKRSTGAWRCTRRVACGLVTSCARRFGRRPRDLLNGSGEFRCLYVNVEAGQSARGDVEAAMRAILGRLATLAEVTLKDDFPKTTEKIDTRTALSRRVGSWDRKRPDAVLQLRGQPAQIVAEFQTRIDRDHQPLFSRIRFLIGKCV